MSVVVVRYSERPELWGRIAGLSAEVWPEYNLHGAVLTAHWSSLYDEFPEYQFVLYDDERDDVLAEGQTVPCVWDGSVASLGPGIDDTVVRSFAVHRSGVRPNTLCALAAEIPPRNQQRRLAATMLTSMVDIARESGFAALIAPVRPNWKVLYPISPIERYVRWTREDGSAFDPWLRTHLRLGASLGPALPRSLRISAPIGEWERWTSMRFPESGDYVFPGCLAPLHVDTRLDVGEYFEPNVWLLHRLHGPVGAE